MMARELTVSGHGNDYTNEEMFEQCLTCEKVSIGNEQNSNIVFSVECSEGHTPTLKFSSESEGDTLLITESYCQYRIGVKK